MESTVHERVVEVLPRIREEAARTEAERRIPTEVLAALLDSGVFALGAPADRTERADRLLDVVGLVGGACGSTGWVTAHAAAVPWLLDLFPHQAWTDLRGEMGIDPLVGFSLEAAGSVHEHEDGLVVRGRWSAVTGAAHAGWLVLAARRSADGEPGPVGLVLVETAAARLEGSVDAVGLTAWGAQDVHLSDVVVPRHAWAGIGDRAPSLAPVGAIVATALAGAARGALEIHFTELRQRVELTQAGEEVTSRDLSPIRVARAASSLDAADLVLRTPTDTDPDAQARNPFDDQLYAIERSVEAVGLVFGSVRSHALDNDDPVARLWRDVRVGAHHARALVSRLRMLGA
ncbi:hypothetical protein WBG06_12775 [Nocardioides sp. CCNWLW239]|uniref:hypothetical protein n=1 Tax=Nocardioides sp. CCNWLW239 TaxID=3128902 RepID=UPI00301A157A